MTERRGMTGSQETVSESIRVSHHVQDQELEAHQTHGAWLMLSIPPATMHELVPRARDCAASMMVFIPEAQTLLMVVASVVLGILSSVRIHHVCV